MDLGEKKGRILGENKGFFHSFILTSALFPITVSIIVSYLRNIIYLDWFVMQITCGGYLVKHFVMCSLSISTTKINLRFFKRVSNGSWRRERVGLIKCL